MSSRNQRAVDPKKIQYGERLKKLVSDYRKVFIVGADNVGSAQFQQIRVALRGKAVVLMGKNTVIRKVLKEIAGDHKGLDTLLPKIHGNVGFVFTNSGLKEVRDVLLANKVGAPAKVGTIAPCDVIVKAGPTGLEPTQTGFLQALNIQSQIVKGQIEIKSDVHLIKVGDKVGQSQATLLQKLNIKPFSYGLAVQSVFDDGVLYDIKVLDIADEDLIKKFNEGVQNIAALSLAANFPTIASVPHSISGGYRNLLAIAVETAYTFKQAEEIKNILANPEAFAAAAAAAAAASAPAAAAPKAAEKKEEKKEEEKEKSEDEAGGVGGLFGDDEW